MEEKKQRLFRLLWSKSYKYRDDPPFTLVSGKTSPHYLDCKPTTNNAEGMNLIGELLFDSIKDLDVKAIGGLTMGADPLAHATSMISYQKGRPINSFCVRKHSKEHGMRKTHRVEGDVETGDRVVIVEDVMTTGESTLQAIEAAKEFGLDIVKILVLVDREDQGRENIRKVLPDVAVESVFLLSEFVAYKP